VHSVTRSSSGPVEVFTETLLEVTEEVSRAFDTAVAKADAEVKNFLNIIGENIQNLRGKTRSR